MISVVSLFLFHKFSSGFALFTTWSSVLFDFGLEVIVCQLALLIQLNFDEQCRRLCFE